MLLAVRGKIIMDVSVIHIITDWFPVNHPSDLVHLSHWHASVDWPVLAQNVTDPDVLGQIQRWWNNVIKSGQLWALLIGLILGYVVRGITA